MNPADRPATEPRTEAGRDLLEALPDYVDGTKPYVRRDLRQRILAIEAEAAQGAAPLDLLRDLVQHWDAGDIDHDYDAISGAFDAARDLVRATIGLPGEHRHPERSQP